MKKIFVSIGIIMLAMSLTACGTGTDSETSETAAQSAATEQSTNASEPQSTDDQATVSEETVYEFEFTDIDGNVHKLSDYRGKPVYLRVWASWCSVCISSLDSLDQLAGEAEDFEVLSVVMPSLSGEMSAEDFTQWYKELGYENLTVLLDPDAQIVYDFGINAFPSQIMFDAQGHIVYGFVGLMSSDQITDAMENIIKGIV